MGEDELVSFGFSVLQLDQTLIALILNHLHAVARGIIEETLNAYLDSEADRICGAHRHERNATRKDRRAGTYRRALSTAFGTLNLKIPKLRNSELPITVIDRLQCQQNLIERILVKMYLTHASHESVEAMAAALLGSDARPCQRRNFGYRIRAKLDAWQHQYIGTAASNIHVDVVDIQRPADFGSSTAKLLVASAVHADGQREMLAIQESNADSEDDTSGFLRDLRARGLNLPRTLTAHGRHQMRA
jgi:transposase-like protein